MTPQAQFAIGIFLTVLAIVATYVAALHNADKKNRIAPIKPEHKKLFNLKK